LGALLAWARRLLTRKQGHGQPQPAAEGAREVVGRTVGYWDQAHTAIGDSPAFPGSWTSHPVVRAAVMRRISGRSDLDWIEWVKQRFLPHGVERALSMGCGAGHCDRAAGKVGLFRSLDGIDVSSAAIALAVERANKAGLSGLSYRVADINTELLPQEAYDLVVFKQSLHHVDALEHVLGQVRRTLRPRAWLVLNEFIGPSRLQWTDEQLAIANELLAALPERLRQVAGAAGRIRQQIERVPLTHFATADPSEAVRSAEIVPLLSAGFEIVERRDFGGTILYPLLQDIIDNFDPARDADNALLRLLLAFEDQLLARRILPSDNAVIVARRPD